MNNNLLCSTILAAVILGPAISANAVDPCGACPGDLVVDRKIDVNDLFQLLAQWGPCGAGCGNCPADLTGPGGVPDCDVNVSDLFLLLSAWGTCGFDYGQQFPDAEAHQIALEMSIGLISSAADYNRIVRDLGLIRAAYPALASQGHTPAWAPTQLIVGLNTALPHDDYECLNGWYGVTNESFLFGFGGVDYYVVTFPGWINVEALGAEYTNLAEVSSADPDYLIGGQNYYIPSRLITGNWQWDIDDGWHDCFDGCDCHHTYVIETDDAGNVILIDEQQFGQSWCEFPK